MDLCHLIVSHNLPADFAKKNNFDDLSRHVYEKLHQDFYNKVNGRYCKKTNKQKCICQ